MIALDVVQGTQEWMLARLGIPTASQFSRIVTAKTRKLSASSGKYLCELVAERIIGRPVNDASTDFMLRGSQLEAAAVEAYEFDNDCQSVKVGFVLDDSRRWGCSPDRLVGEDGLLEIKCPSAAVHVAALLGLQDDEHFAQVQGQLWVTGRKWCDVRFYNPALPSHEVRVERDEDYIADLAVAVRTFCDRLDAAHARLSGEVGQPAKVAGTEGTEAPDYSAADHLAKIFTQPRADKLEMMECFSVDDMTLELARLRAATKGTREFYRVMDSDGRDRMAIVDADLLTQIGRVKNGGPVNTWLDQIRNSATAWPLFCDAVLTVKDSLGQEAPR